RSEIGAADVADFALPHEIRQCAQRFFERSQLVELVKLIEIDVISPKALQAGLDFLHDVQTRGADLIRARAHPAKDLGGEDDILPFVSERLARQGFGFTGRINVRGIDEIDARVEGVSDKRINVVLLKSADGFEDTALAAKRHRAEADPRDEHTRVAELGILHESYFTNDR